MAFALLVLLLLSFAGGCAYLAWAHARRVGRLTTLDWALIAAGGVFGAVQCVLLLIHDYTHIPFWPYPGGMPLRLHYLHLALSAIAVGSLLLGWYVSAPALPLKAPGLDAHAQLYRRRLYSLALVLLVLAVSTQFLYSMALGGMVNALEHSLAIRSGIAEVHNPFSFLARMPGFVFVSLLIFVGLWQAGKRSLFLALLIIFSAAFSIYTLFNWLARMYFAYLLASLVLGYLISNAKKPANLLFHVLLFSAAGIWVVYEVSVMLELKGQESFLAFVSKEFSFLFIAFNAYMDAADFEHLLFESFYLSPLYLMPASLLPELPATAVQINTYNITGALKGSAGNTSGMPVDLITLGMMQAGVLGLVVVGTLFGTLLRVVQYLVDTVKVPEVRAFLGAFFAFMFAVHGLFYSDPSVFLKENFANLASLVLLAYLSKSRA